MTHSTLLDMLPDSVGNLHRKGWPDHRIASRLKVGIAWVRAERKRLGIKAHPPESRLTEFKVWDELLQWERFIWRYAAGWVKRYPELDIEDVRSEAIAGALRAGERFDPRKGYVFTTYAVAWMRNQVQRYVERELCFGLSGSGERGRIKRMPVFQFADGERDEANELPDSTSVSYTAAWWTDMLAGLTETEQSCVVLRFKDDVSVAEIGRKLGMSSAAVSRILDEAIAWMRRRAG
jgi:RNA polymerase sigma factor (sigma-70 family)